MPGEEEEGKGGVVCCWEGGGVVDKGEFNLRWEQWEDPFK